VHDLENSLIFVEQTMMKNSFGCAFAGKDARFLMAMGMFVLLCCESRIVAQTGPSELTKPQTIAGVEVVGPDAPIRPGVALSDRVTEASQCTFSACNPPMQPQVATGRCLPCIRGVDCADNCGSHQTWRDLHPMEFQPLGHGEFLGPVRLPNTVDYRVRVGDRIQFIFARDRERPVETYTLLVGDELQITSLSNPDLKMGDLVQGRGISIQPDGFLHLNGIGRIRAAGLSIAQLRRNLELAYRELYNEPAIDVIPIKTNTQQDDILESIDARQGVSGGRTLTETVHQDGTIRLIPIGAVCVQGLTVDELKREINLRYRQLVPGLHIEPIIEQEAPHFIFVYGEVGQPDRYQLLGPTSVTQALAMARGINIKGNAREVVIFRRAEDWRLLATRLDLKGMHLGKVPTPADEIWLRDNDLIIVPKTPIGRFNEFVEQVFRQGIYGIFPFSQVGTGLNVIGFPVGN
jgi:polysaccharide export outer membrane protein